MRSKTSAAFMLFGTFALGGVTGVVGHSLYRSHVDAPTAKAASRPQRPDIVEELARNIPLDPDQKDKLRVIIGKTRERFRELHKQTGPQFQAIRNEGWDELRPLLRPDQRARFEEIVRGLDSRRRSGDRPPPPTSR